MVTVLLDSEICVVAGTPCIILRFVSDTRLRRIRRDSGQNSLQKGLRPKLHGSSRKLYALCNTQPIIRPLNAPSCALSQTVAVAIYYGHICIRPFPSQLVERFDSFLSLRLSRLERHYSHRRPSSSGVS